MNDKNTAQEQPGTTALYTALTHNERKPLYITDINHEGRAALCREGAAAVFDLDTINNELNGELKRAGASDFFAHQFNPEGLKKASPVIILYNEKDQKAKLKAANVFKILTNTGLTVFKQSAARSYKAITCAGPEETRAALVEQYRKNFSVGGNIAEFDNVINSNANTPAIKTGFKFLDQVLEGGLYEGLYTIGAISSLGKTAFCGNIADNIATAGHDVIIFSFEMSKFEFMARSISKLTFAYFLGHRDTIKYEWCKTERGITDGSRYKFYAPDEIDLINKCKSTYAAKAGQHLYIYESIGEMSVNDIASIVKAHIENTGNKPVVIIDYLQLIKNEDPRINSNDKVKTDANLTALKKLSRDEKLAIIAISSFNRNSYETRARFESFKESGSVEYTSSVLLALQLAGVEQDNFNVNEAKAKNPREIELVILKNRQGKSGDTIKYYYYPMFNFFYEDPNGLIERKTEPQAPKTGAKAQAQKKAADLERLNALFSACEVNGRASFDDMTKHQGGANFTRAALIKQFKQYPEEFTISGGTVERSIEI